eukprot:TRINITY_DN2963_c1_g2_i1.p3 TRINITY_DN2963_c1_g2~~TRINITY_DN2963_c1_g2_i1.p3  ORF type:complete len:307 (-),score=48.33 TRINITY_DN2963_c1_g2_i1:1615-2535(-)
MSNFYQSVVVMSTRGCTSIFYLLLVLSQGQQQGLSTSDDCEATINGCVCQFSWLFGGEEYRGCNNPDGDPQGDWCMIEEGTCIQNEQLVATQRITLEDESTSVGFFDYCYPGCLQQGFPYEQNQCVYGNQTLVECSCLKEWQFTANQQTQTLSYCQNPDNDPGGAWCKIDESRGCDFDELEERNQFIRSQFDGEILNYWDYCNQDCGGLVRNEVLDRVIDDDEEELRAQPATSSGASFGSAGAQTQSPSSISGPSSDDSANLPTNAPQDVVPTTPKVSNEQDTTSNSSSSGATGQSMSSGSFMGSG